jgi:hypothetical protein
MNTFLASGSYRFGQCPVSDRPIKRDPPGGILAKETTLDLGRKDFIEIILIKTSGFSEEFIHLWLLEKEGRG